VDPRSRGGSSKKHALGFFLIYKKMEKGYTLNLDISTLRGVVKNLNDENFDQNKKEFLPPVVLALLAKPSVKRVVINDSSFLEEIRSGMKERGYSYDDIKRRFLINERVK
jgi:hypothetical protein